MQEYKNPQDKTIFLEIWNEIHSSEKKKKSDAITPSFNTKPDAKFVKDTQASILKLLEHDQRFSQLQNRTKLIQDHKNLTDFKVFKRLSIGQIGEVKAQGFFESSTIAEQDTLNNSIYQLLYVFQFIPKNTRIAEEFLWCMCIPYSSQLLQSKHLYLQKKEQDYHFLFLSHVDIPRRVLCSYTYDDDYFINTHDNAEIRKYRQFHM